MHDLFGSAPSLRPLVPLMEIEVLGPIAVNGDSGEEVVVPGARPKGLLALLALDASRIVPTDTILEALWGDSDIANREAALHTTVNRLRKAIGNETIQTEPGGYRLNLPATSTDVARFQTHLRRARQMHTLGHARSAAESYRRALAQWRGPALTDLRQFEFAEQAARQLDEERLGAVESLMDAMLSEGAHEQVASELSGLVEDFPYRERLWQLLMLALYRSGRQTEALEAFREIRTRLGEELGIEPWPSLVDLEERILLHDPALTGFSVAPDELPQDIEYLDFRPGEVIIEEGDEASSIYWIEEGEVEVLRSDDEDEQIQISVLGPGRYFGELAAMLGTTRYWTVRALVPTTVSVYDVNSFRARMMITDDPPDSPPNLVARLEDLIDRGHYLEAYDIAAQQLEWGESTPRVRYLAVLALARSGATSQARRRYQQYGLDKLDRTTLDTQVGQDIAVLAARLDKDQALRHPGDRTAWAERSARGYESAYETSQAGYHAANAATMWLLAGDTGRANVLAKSVLAEENAATDYWSASTEAEAALIVGDLERVRRALRTAGDAGASWSQHATTLKQLGLVCGLKGLDETVLDPIRNPTVIHYSGHRSLVDEDRVRREVVDTLEALDIGIGFGSLAAGADVVVAEALLARGAELNVVLPFPHDEFVRTSVAPAGKGWVDRFDQCLARATSVEVATTSEYLDDPVLFDFCARIAMGEALIRAVQLETTAHQLAIWDRAEPTAGAGTAVDVGHWAATGASSIVVSTAPRDVFEQATPQIPREIRAMVFADFVGHASLSDAQLVTFQESIMGGLSNQIEPFREHVLSAHSWGNHVGLVFDDVAPAAEAALEMIEYAGELDYGDRLEALRGLRVVAHAAPVFAGTDPLSGDDIVYGMGLTQTAAIESRTPPGEIYTTKAFAALAVLASSQTLESHYVGNLPTARKVGQVPLYSLRRKVARE